MLNRLSCLLQSAPLVLLTIFSQIITLRAAIINSAETLPRTAQTSAALTRTGQSAAKDLLHPSPRLSETHSPPSFSELSGLPKPHEDLPPLTSLAEPDTYITPRKRVRLNKQAGWDSYITSPRSEKTSEINELLDRYAGSNDPEEKFSRLQEAMKKMTELSSRQSGADGEKWLKAIEAICQDQHELETELRMNTLVSFGYRDIMFQLSHTPSAASSDQKTLFKLISELQNDREEFYRGKVWSTEYAGPRGRIKTLERKAAIRSVDWSQETLLPFEGLGNSEKVESFRRMIAESPSLQKYFEKARKRPTWSIVVGRYLPSYENKLVERNEANFIRRLGRTATRTNGETDAQTKTASIILLWQLKNKGAQALDGLFADFSFTSSKAQHLASKQVVLLLHPKTVNSLWDNDKVLLQTLEIRQNVKNSFKRLDSGSRRAL
ncbi:hypothetical protein PCANC_13163 [Puccinia coronata f. sp. avenae]|uniref:Uncharacterized protein n=1 Tax=Puccinia coronata f. sp. avenae TaxID=200324 RepID=A0A2N5UVP9_9BASI|nr:hypothetical protein PCASD_21881 [Puccinia coronata f. sp. avenae]PLW41696.1 hypothetical protein PCANC_13163 [Puccinia coronata f. sp. avenae]